MHVYQGYPFSKNIGKHYNKIEITNRPSSDQTNDPRVLFASEDLKRARDVLIKADFFRQRDARYLHFSKQHP